MSTGSLGATDMARVEIGYANEEQTLARMHAKKRNKHCLTAGLSLLAAGVGAAITYYTHSKGYSNETGSFFASMLTYIISVPTTLAGLFCMTVNGREAITEDHMAQHHRGLAREHMELSRQYRKDSRLQ